MTRLERGFCADPSSIQEEKQVVLPEMSWSSDADQDFSAVLADESCLHR
ncbi:hypothetical protein [Streptomyces sp. NBC_01716]|nr:hypothetical protein [Streptomyces sp. NBC_01716]